MPEQSGSQKEPFVGAQDRPEMRLNPDEPITHLRVRDLIALLGVVGTKSVVAETPLGHKSHLKDVLDAAAKTAVKDVSDAWRKEIKDMADTYVIGGGSIDPGLARTVDALVREVAQLREAVNQLRR